MEAGKYLKPYQGLKQKNSRHPSGRTPSRKIPKTLSGIETCMMLFTRRLFTAGKYLKPYQGLKHPKHFDKLRDLFAGKYLKPYQGLKPTTFSCGMPADRPENT